MRRRSLHRRRFVALLLVVLFAAPAFAFVLPGASAGERPIDERVLDTIVARSTLVPAPAVAERTDGTLVGVSTLLEISIRNGTGAVYVDTRPLTQLDMQGSARLAATTAAALAGMPMTEHDFFVTMRADSPTVGGPSAGAVMTVAFLALLRDWPLRDDVVMTGMINPDGTVGPVGGILEKAEAAHNAGASVFLVPEGQSVVTRYVRETSGEGFFQQERLREERVDVADHAKRTWGLDVIEVRDVYAAVTHFTGFRLQPPVPVEAKGSAVYERIMHEHGTEQYGSAMAEADRVTAALAASTISGDARADLEARLVEARDRLDNASDALGSGLPYTASSLAFQARITLREVDLVISAVESGDQRAFLADRGRTIVSDLERFEVDAVGRTPRTVSVLEAVGAAQVRVLEAERLVRNAEVELEADLVADALGSLAFAEERTRSVGMWLRLADRLGTVETGAIVRADVGPVSTEYVGIARQAFGYAQVLVGEAGSSSLTVSLLGEAGRDLQDAVQAADKGLDVAALYLAMEAQVASHAALSLVGSENLIEDRVDRQRERALIEIERTRSLGAEPVLAVSYLDFAGSLRDTLPQNSLLLYGFAATVASTSALLAGDTACGLVSGSCAGAPGFVASPAYEVTDPWTGYLALASLVLGFLAGGLVFMVVHDDRVHRHERAKRAAAIGGTIVAVPGAAAPAATTRRRPGRLRRAAMHGGPATVTLARGRAHGPLPAGAHTQPSMGTGMGATGARSRPPLD